MSLNLFIIGPSGCGKSTQAKLIAQKYNLTHFSMGQLLRDEIASGSKLGLDTKASVDAGIPTPDDIVLPILSQKLISLSNQNFIVDGFPRLIQQGHYIDHFLIDKGQSTSLVIHLLVNFLEIQKRREKLGVSFQDNTRSDNTPEAIANRQKILYEQGIAPILDHYRVANRLYEVDGNRPIEPIFEDICKVIDNINS
ncbi:MAG: nucleoside monophosphate kinase [Candidatus Shapirobacteria bacterium]|jgi:adenylate kinase